MEQLPLFAHEEMIRNSAMKALINGEFHNSGRLLEELKRLYNTSDFHEIALGICRYWTLLYRSDEAFKQEEPLEIYKQWRIFEKYIKTKAYENHAILREIKRNIFLLNMGLSNPTPLLRQAFEEYGTTALDLLIEIGEWKMAVKEINNIIKIHADFQNWLFFLKFSKVYNRAGDTAISRYFLLKTFRDQPDLITIDDIFDPELISALHEIGADYRISEGLVELVPYVILMTGLFAISPEDCRGYIVKVQGCIEKLERIGDTGKRMHYRLFSLYTWKAELAKFMGLDFVDVRNSMKLLDNQLFQHYMTGIKDLEGQTLLRINF